MTSCSSTTPPTMLVLPSKGEGFGLPVVEAMACGLPVAASDRNSLPEVLGGAGLLFDPDSDEAIAASILRLLREPELRADLRARGLARARGVLVGRRRRYDGARPRRRRAALARVAAALLPRHHLLSAVSLRRRRDLRAPARARARRARAQRRCGSLGGRLSPVAPRAAARLRRNTRRAAPAAGVALALVSLRCCRIRSAGPVRTRRSCARSSRRAATT